MDHHRNSRTLGIGMDRFALRTLYRIEQSAGEGAANIIVMKDAEGFGELFTFLRTSLPESLKLIETAAANDVINRPPHEPFAAKLPVNPKDLVAPDVHWARISKLQALLEGHSVVGTGELGNLPAGWLTVLEMAVDGWIELLKAEPTAKVSISQIKEKFGTLRVYAQATGSEGFVKKFNQIRQWSQAASVSRCMVTGHRGYIDAEGWVVTLCPQAMFWRRRYPDIFDQIIYPRLPRDQAGD